MVWLIASVLLGLLMLVLGVAIIVYPEKLRKSLYWFLDPRNIYKVAAIRIASGGIFIMAAPYLFLPTLVYGLGVLLIAAGIIVPCMGRKRLERLEQWWLTVPDRTLRLWGLASVVAGALVMWISI